MTFRIGQKVVTIVDWGERGFAVPKQGEVYTVSGTVAGTVMLGFVSGRIATGASVWVGRLLLPPRGRAQDRYQRVHEDADRREGEGMTEEVSDAEVAFFEIADLYSQIDDLKKEIARLQARIQELEGSAEI